MIADIAVTIAALVCAFMAFMFLIDFLHATARMSSKFWADWRFWARTFALAFIFLCSLAWLLGYAALSLWRVF